MTPTKCFLCSRVTLAIYYVEGMPLCSSCKAQAELKGTCARCGMLQKTSQIRYVNGLKYCVTCANILLNSKGKTRTVATGPSMSEKIAGGAREFYRKPRKGEYYVERSPLPFVQSIIHIAIIFLIFILAANEQDQLAKTAFLLFGAFLLIMLITFATIRIKIYDDEIRCLYGIFTYVIRKNEIIMAEIVEPDRFMGYGLLLSWNKGPMVKFITGKEPGLILRKKEGFFKSVLISSPDPVKLLNSIAKKMQ